MLERLADMAAKKLGMDRVEIRRRNLISAQRDALQDAARSNL